MWVATSILFFLLVVLVCARLAPDEWLLFLVDNAQWPALGWFLVMSALSAYLMQRAKQVESIDGEARPETIYHRARVVASLESRLGILMCVMVLVGLYTLIIPALVAATQGELKRIVASTLPGFFGLFVFVLLSWLSWLRSLGKIEAEIKAKIRRREMRRHQLEKMDTLSNKANDVEVTTHEETIEGILSMPDDEGTEGQDK